MTYRTNYELTTPSIPAWRRFGLWLNPQRWRLARKARGGKWLHLWRTEIDIATPSFIKAIRPSEWVQWFPASIDAAAEWEDALKHFGKHAIAHEDHGEVWG